MKFGSNHILWLAMFLFDVIRTVMLGVHLLKTFARDIEEGSFSPLALEEERT
jgi:hypothetical protein